MSALLAAATAACSGDSTGTPEPSEPGVNIISGAALTDTVLALPTAPLRVRVRGTDGKPRPGVEVRFRSGDLGMNLVDGAGRPLVIGVDTTDGQGYASALVRFGTTAGPAQVVVSVPALGAQATASYTVLPGAPATLTAGPADSTVYAGGSYRLRGIVTDRFWNPLTMQQPVFTALSGPVSMRDGIVTGEQIGRGRVEVRLGTLTDTADVSVVPQGVLAVRTYNGINGTATEVATVQLDGSQMRAIAPGLNRSGLPAQGVAWSPNGAEVLLSQATGLTLADPAGAGSRMVLGQVTRGARFSRDGQWIYFSNMTVLFRVRPDGSGLERVDPGHDTPYNSTYNYAPSPSPDGRFLAYVANPGYVNGELFVRILDVATRTRVGFSLSGRNIGWSPTGDLVYHDRNEVLRLIRPDGTLIRELGAYQGRVAWFDWSPDGRWLLVAAEWGLPVILIDVTTGMRLPLAWTSSMSESAWRP
ncbi:MAG TPA: hypothetical protein VGB92_25195 [Longimicrobium sp.]|jgi:hypothetical protein